MGNEVGDICPSISPQIRKEQREKFCVFFVLFVPLW